MAECIENRRKTLGLYLLPTHLWGLLLFLVVIARRRTCVRRRAALATVRAWLCVCVTVCLSVVSLTVGRGSDATGYPGRGEDGGAVGGQRSRGGGQDFRGGAGRRRATRVRWGVESCRGPGNIQTTSCENAKHASVCSICNKVEECVMYCESMLWPFNPQVQCSALCIYEVHGLCMTELCTNMVANGNQLIILLQSSSARFAAPAYLQRGKRLMTHEYL